MKLGLEYAKTEQEDAVVSDLTFYSTRTTIDPLFLQDIEHHVAQWDQTTAVLCSNHRSTATTSKSTQCWCGATVKKRHSFHGASMFDSLRDQISFSKTSDGRGDVSCACEFLRKRLVHSRANTGWNSIVQCLSSPSNSSQTPIRPLPIAFFRLATDLVGHDRLWIELFFENRRNA